MKVTEVMIERLSKLYGLDYATKTIDGKKLVSEQALNAGVVGENNSFKHKQKLDTSKIKKEGEYTVRLVFSYMDEKNNRKNIKKDTILKVTGEI